MYMYMYMYIHVCVCVANLHSRQSAKRPSAGSCAIYRDIEI